VDAPVERALGLRVKLGWALAVAVERDPDERPAVLARDELRVAPHHRIFGYHEAMEAEPDEREAIVAAAAGRAADAATELLAEAAAEHEVDAVAIVVGRGVRRIPIDRIIASSQLFHTAEAELLQQGFAEAAARLGLPCRRPTFAELEADADWPLLATAGRAALGPPWQKDHKLAATAAWVALR
jgi:hypothetical protein